MKTLLILSLVFSATVAAPTCEQIKTMTQALRDSVKANPGFQPMIVRLGFHSCVGGCDGCVNFGNPDNKGLETVFDTLKQVYEDNDFQSFGVSRADFFALATTYAARIAIRNANTQRNGGQPCENDCPGLCPVPCFELTWGRQDASDCTLKDATLPSPTLTGDEMFGFFEKEFGFTRAQVVALMGAHSLGGAKRFNSGYSGKWTGPTNEGLSEIFYYNLLNKTNTWFKKDASNDPADPKWQFRGLHEDGSAAGFYLNTDVELFYDLTLDPVTAEPLCKLSPTCGLDSSCDGSCPVASTFEQAKTYATDCSAFMPDFQDVLQLMLQNGFDNLETFTCC